MKLYCAYKTGGEKVLIAADDLSPPVYASTPHKWTIHRRGLANGESYDYIDGVYKVENWGDFDEEIEFQKQENAIELDEIQRATIDPAPQQGLGQYFRRR